MRDKYMDILTYVILFVFLIALPLGCGIFLLNRHWKTVDVFSCEKAEKAAQKYLSKYHPGSDYEISSSGYDDKNEYYYVTITSPSSQDSSFSLKYDRKGKLKFNSYEHSVTKRANVAVRLNGGYASAVDTALEPAAPWDDFGVVGNIHWRTSDTHLDAPYYLISDELELDASYDLSEIGGKSGYLWIHVDVETAEEATLEELASILLYVRQTLDEADLPFYHLDCMLDYHNGTSSIRWEVEDFLYEDIYEEGLLDRLENVAVLS